MDMSGYGKTDWKLDKRFSILPTVLQAVGEVKGKTIVDIGCGGGFFTLPLARKGATVIGIDSSLETLGEARRQLPGDLSSQIEYREGDMHRACLPRSDVIVAPFVLGYCSSVNELQALIGRFYQACEPAGCLVSVIDAPIGRTDLIAFGARKILPDQVDAAEMLIELYVGGELVWQRTAQYYLPQTVATCCLEAGFSRVEWLEPILDPAGLQAATEAEWRAYLAEPELRYLRAWK